MKIVPDRNSLQSKLMYWLVISLTITSLSLGFSLFYTMKLQRVGELRFEREQYLNDLQTLLDDLQPPLENYMGTRSSSSLGKLLYLEETIRETLPENRYIPESRTGLLLREIYFLIDGYLNEVNLIIEEKRGRKVQAYTLRYEQLSQMYSYISRRVDAASLSGFRSQLEEYRHFMELFGKMQTYSLLLILLAVIFSFSFLLQTMNSLSHPLQSLSAMAEKISTGNFEINDISVNSVTEVNRVALAFNNMKNSIHHYIEEMKKKTEMEQQIMNERLRNMKMEQILKRMELYTMQAQMNPHFLFNTINTGVQLAIVEEAEKTADFMENLAALFRYNIRESKFFIPLRHEYDGLISYFEILKIRFPKTLNPEIKVPEELLDKFECPAMILQPLAENSVLHAFKTKEGIGKITVEIKSLPPFLELSVTDNGTGISEDIISQLLVPHTHEYQLSSKVMGLENVIQRLYFFYPEQKDVITINSRKGEGTEIIIRINTEAEPCIGL